MRTPKARCVAAAELKNRAVKACLIYGAWLAITLPSTAQAQDPPTIKTVTHPLQFAKTPTATLSNSEADDIVSLGTNVLGQCRTVFSRPGAVQSIAGIPSVVNSDVDLSSACGASLAEVEDPMPAGVPRRVRVVNAINWCGTAGTGYIGCAYINGTCLVVERYTPFLEGILIAHEFGHSKGLQHRTDSTNAVMYPSVSPERTVFTTSECNSIRAISLITSAHKVSAPQTLAPMPITEFVTQAFYDGVPYAEARLYTSAEVSSISPWLKDKSKSQYWANVATTIGMVADQKSFSVLRDFIFSPGTGPLPSSEYDGRSAAIMSLGYVVRGNGDASARSFLQRRTQPSTWGDVSWRAPYHADEAQKNIDLAAISVLGISLIEDEGSLMFLKTLKFTGLKMQEVEILDRVVRQAIEDTESARFKRVEPPANTK